MKKFLTSLLILALSASVFGADDTCSSFQKAAKEMNKKMPFLADKATENTHVTVNCPNKVINYKKRLLIDHNLLKDGWEQRMAEKHHQLHCNKIGFASVNKWTVTDEFYSTDYQYIATIKTIPSDCN